MRRATNAISPPLWRAPRKHSREDLEAHPETLERPRPTLESRTFPPARSRPAPPIRRQTDDDARPPYPWTLRCPERRDSRPRPLETPLRRRPHRTPLGAPSRWRPLHPGPEVDLRQPYCAGQAFRRSGYPSDRQRTGGAPRDHSGTQTRRGGGLLRNLVALRQQLFRAAEQARGALRGAGSARGRRHTSTHRWNGPGKRSRSP